MKIWNGTNTVYLNKYPIAENLLFSIVAETPEKELLPFEKLFIALNSGISCHSGYLTDVYMDCGCFDKAKEAYIAAGHQRKLGDICWVQGNFKAAEQHYLNPISNAQSYRKQPDYDRLIKLSFAQEHWNNVICRFIEAHFIHGFTKNNVRCGNSEMAARPFLEMLAIALTAMSIETPAEAQAILASAFDLSATQWNEFRNDPQFNDIKTIQKIKRRCPPSFGKKAPITVEDAITRGNTLRANDILNYIKQCNGLLCEAQNHLEQFGRAGNESDLNRFIEIVTYSGITSVSHSFLFSAMGHNSFSPPDVPSDWLIKLYGAHPIMDRQYFGKLLQVKFDNHIPLVGSEIVTGLFQQVGSITAVVEPESIQDSFGFSKLIGFQDWAELCLDDWISEQGDKLIKNVACIWREGRAENVRPQFGSRETKKPITPRDMLEWNELLNFAAKWLQKQWQQEIGLTAWVSENQLFQLLKRQLKEMTVQQHAQPAWILPQHLDIYIPEASIAIEYMGQQHYKPIDFFGGDSGFAAVQERDIKKRQKCQAHNIKLYFVKHDENLGKRVKAIITDIRLQNAGR